MSVLYLHPRALLVLAYLTGRVPQATRKRSAEMTDLGVSAPTWRYGELAASCCPPDDLKTIADTPESLSFDSTNLSDRSMGEKRARNSTRVSYVGCTENVIGVSGLSDHEGQGEGLRVMHRASLLRRVQGFGLGYKMKLSRLFRSRGARRWSVERAVLAIAKLSLSLLMWWMVGLFINFVRGRQTSPLSPPKHTST